MSSRCELSEHIKLVLTDGDELWPSTVDGSFRLIRDKEGHNILGAGEHPVSEAEMIDGVLNHKLPTRWRSRKNPDRMKSANHFSVSSPKVREVHAKVGGVWVRVK